MNMSHQYVERRSGKVITENFLGDELLRRIYAKEREDSHWLFRALTSARMSSLLACLHFDLAGAGNPEDFRCLCGRHGLNPEEFVVKDLQFKSLRDFFERKIKYREYRPMPEEENAVVSPADSRVIPGSFDGTSSLFIKEKFFSFHELLGMDKAPWHEAFHGGDFAVFRLTPDKYHYNHTPVAGRVADFYELPGCYRSCNPHAVVREVTPYSKNKRFVTIIDTDVSGGTGAGLVAMVEIVALMIGRVVQCYSETGYENPAPVETGMMLRKGVPKSLFRPGSSTVVLVFQKNRFLFDDDLVSNLFAPHVNSRFSMGFGLPLVETDLQVRSRLGTALKFARVRERE